MQVNHWIINTIVASNTRTRTFKALCEKSKFDPLVDEVELIEANPNYAHIRSPDGREDTVALKYLAPKMIRRLEKIRKLRNNSLMIQTSHLSHQLSRKSQTMSRIENMLHTIRQLLNRPQRRIMEILCHHNNSLMKRYPHHHKHLMKLLRPHYDAHNGSGAHLTDISL